MKNLFILLFISSIVPQTSAQKAKSVASIPCPEFEEIINKIRHISKDQHLYDSAFVMLNALRDYCPKYEEKIRKETAMVVSDIRQRNKKIQSQNKKLSKQIELNNKLIDKLGFSKFGLAWAYKDGKFAVINKDGINITPYEFENPKPFALNGRSVAEKQGLFYSISREGKPIGPFEYMIPTNISHYKIKSDGKFSFINNEFTKILQLDWFDEIGAFKKHEKLEIISTNGKYGFIDNNANVVLPAAYSELKALDSTNIAFFDDQVSKWGIINKSNGKIIKPTFDDILERKFINRYFICQQESKWGMIDSTGKTYINYRFDEVSDISENGLQWIKIAGKSGAIDSAGRLVIEPIYDRKINFKNSVADDHIWLQKNGLWGAISTNGHIIVPFSYDRIPKMVKSMKWYIVYRVNKWGIIDSTGRVLIDPVLDSPNFPDDEIQIFNGLFWVSKSKKWGAINEEGEFVINMEYDNRPSGTEELLEHFERQKRTSSSSLWLRRNGKWVMVNPTGKVINEKQYDQIASSGIVQAYNWVQSENSWGVIDSAGNTITKPIFNQLMTAKSVCFVYSDTISRWAMCTKTGTLLTKFDFETVVSFSEHFYWVSKDNKWAIINEFGSLVTKFEFNYPSETAVWGSRAIWADNSGHGGIISENGDVISNIKFHGIYIDYLSETPNFRWVSYKDKWGVINTKGELILDFDYEYPISSENFTLDLVWIKKGVKFGLFNTLTGEIIIQPILDNKGIKTSHNYAWIEQDNKIGLINNSGRIILNPSLDSPPEYSALSFKFIGNHAWCSKNRKWGMIDTTGNIKIDFLYDSAPTEQDYISNGNFWIRRNGYWGVIDSTGHTIREFVYSDKGHTMKHLTCVSRGNMWGIIDSSGKTIVEHLYTSIDEETLQEGYVWAAKNGKFGIIDTSGHLKIDHEFDDHFDFSEDKVWVKKGGKWGLINKNGQILIDFRFETVSNFKDGVSFVEELGEEYYINSKGEMIIDWEIDSKDKFTNYRINKGTFHAN